MSPRLQSGVAERERILAALIHEVGEKGYRGTSLSEVLIRAGVDEATFYRHFEDLQAAFLVAWGMVNGRYMELALAAFGGETQWRWRIRAVAEAIFAFVVDDPHQGRILFAEGCNPAEPARSLGDDPHVEAFVALIDAGRQQMDDPEVLTKATAEGIFGAVKEQVARALRQKDHKRLPELFPPLMAMVVRPYLGDEVAAEELRRGPPSV